MGTPWASGRPRFRIRAPAPDSAPSEPQPAAPAPQADGSAQGDWTAGADWTAEAEWIAAADRTAELSPRARLDALAEQASAITAEWAPTAGRILLGVVFAWFGYHELLQPGGWTQYVPVINESSSLAVILVLAHGWVLFVLAAALLAGIAPRAAAAIASVLLLEIVISLAVTGLSATVLRDLGVLGLAVCLTGSKNQRLVLRG
jgi:uncharacterized membrane protein YphA (DoxX/SURF4 family)